MTELDPGWQPDGGGFMRKVQQVFVTGYTGLDVLLYALPERLQARIVAWRFVRQNKGWDPDRAPLVIVITSAWAVSSAQRRWWRPLSWLPRVAVTHADRGTA